MCVTAIRVRQNHEMVFDDILVAEYIETPSLGPGILQGATVDMLELVAAKFGWWNAAVLATLVRMSGIVGGKKDMGLLGSTGVVGMKKNCCVWGDIGVRPENDTDPGMPGLGRLGSR